LTVSVNEHRNVDRLRLAAELEKDVTVLEFDLPDVGDLGRLLDRVIEDVKDNPKRRIDLELAKCRPKKKQ
jgi:hypothetical protein